MHDPHTEPVRRARQGPDAAATDLFDAVWPDAVRTARTILGRSAVAEDVAQESIVRAFGQLARFDGRRPFGAWLRRIVVNRSLNALRDTRRLVALDEGLPGPGMREAPPGGMLADAIRGLAPDRRVAVALRYGLDLTPTEIAEAIDVPVGTVKSRIARGLEVRVARPDGARYILDDRAVFPVTITFG